MGKHGSDLIEDGKANETKQEGALCFVLMKYLENKFGDGPGKSIYFIE